MAHRAFSRAYRTEVAQEALDALRASLSERAIMEGGAPKGAEIYGNIETTKTRRD
jgi:hypothetical protein